MPAGHLHRRLLGRGSQTYLGLLQSQGAEWFFPWDDADLVVTTTGLMDEDIGVYDTSGSFISQGAPPTRFIGNSTAFTTASDACIRFPDNCADKVHCKGFSWSSGVGGSYSFWLNTNTTSTRNVHAWDEGTGATTYQLMTLKAGGVAGDTSIQFRDVGGTGRITLTFNLANYLDKHFGVVCWPDGSGGTDAEVFVNGVSVASGNSTAVAGALMLGSATRANFGEDPNGVGLYLEIQGFAGASNVKWTAADFLAQYNAGQ